MDEISVSDANRTEEEGEEAGNMFERAPTKEKSGYDWTEGEIKTLIG